MAASPYLPQRLCGSAAEALRALVLTALAERDAALAERDKLQTEHDALLARTERLQQWLLKLQRAQFGRKSERLAEDLLQRGLEDFEAAIVKVQAEAAHGDAALRQERATRCRANRGRLPAHLPRFEVELLPPHTACPCCRRRSDRCGQLRAPGRDPVQYWVLVRCRPQFACRACTGVVTQHPAPRDNYATIQSAFAALIIVDAIRSP